MGKAHTRVILSLAILLACCSCALALGPSLDVSHNAHPSWKVREGFATGIIHEIVQSPDSYLWLATEVGLGRFDSVRAAACQPPAGERVPSSDIRGLIERLDGTLWIGTHKGHTCQPLIAGDPTRLEEGRRRIHG